MASRSVGVNMLQSGRMEVSLYVCGNVFMISKFHILSVYEYLKSGQPFGLLYFKGVPYMLNFHALKVEYSCFTSHNNNIRNYNKISQI